MLKSLTRNFLSRIGYMVIRKDGGIPGFPDIEKEFTEILSICRPQSMVSVERMYALYKAVEYVVSTGISGDMVECGVWRGGSSMMMAMTLNKLNTQDKKIYLYDTFEGMSEPTEHDIGREDKPATQEWEEYKRTDKEWFAASLDIVKHNLYSTGYPQEKLVFVKGKVEDTIPEVIPEKISLLRLDTDWYESTRHELEHLFPRLSRNGVLILDDYGYWKGAKKAVDEYIQENNIKILLNRIDTDGRIGIKL